MQSGRQDYLLTGDIIDKDKLLLSEKLEEWVAQSCEALTEKNEWKAGII